MGYASIAWFERGEKLSQQHLKEISKNMTDKLLQSIKSFGKRKSSPKKLKRIIEDTLSSEDMYRLNHADSRQQSEKSIDDSIYYE